jgi:hypothetical protein
LQPKHHTFHEVSEALHEQITRMFRAFLSAAKMNEIMRRSSWAMTIGKSISSPAELTSCISFLIPSTSSEFFRIFSLRSAFNLCNSKYNSRSVNFLNSVFFFSSVRSSAKSFICETKKFSLLKLIAALPFSI